MSVDFTATPSTHTSEGSVFAAVPSWERNRKRRVASSARTAAALPLTASEQGMVETRPPTGEGVFAAPPVYTATARRQSGVAPLAIAAGILAVGGLGAAGWYAYQPHETGVAQLTPGSTTTITTVTPAEPGVQIAASTPAATPPPALTRSSTTISTTTTTRTAPPRTIVTRHSTTTQVSTPVVRPAARSIEDNSVNTAATAPALPAFKGLAPAPAVAASAAPLEAAPAPVVPEVVAAPPATATPPQ